MENEIVFLKHTNTGKFLKVKDIGEADHFRVPKSLYISIDEWNDLVKKHNDLSEKYYELLSQRPTKSEGDDTVTIPKHQYNGFLGALRIVKQRELQQIDKASADKWGFVTKYIDARPYERSRPELKAYCITKTTPLSLHIDLETAYFKIMQDLKEFYNYIDLSAVTTPSYPAPSKIKPLDLLTALSQREDPEFNYDFYVTNSDYGRKIKEFIENNDRPMIFEIIRVSGANVGKGVYEVQYYATGPI